MTRYRNIDGLNMELRFWSKVDFMGDCWNWTGYVDGNGYGRFLVGGRSGTMVGAHQVSFQLSGGRVSFEHELDHLCRNRKCVRPDHLEPVTHAENMRRGVAGEVNGARMRGITHCPKGHEYNEANTRLRPDGRRRCKICEADGQRRYRERNRELLRVRRAVRRTEKERS